MIRIFLLRLLIAWWLIIISWTIGLFIWWLIAGWDEAIDCARDFTKDIWYGEII